MFLWCVDWKVSLGNLFVEVFYCGHGDRHGRRGIIVYMIAGRHQPKRNHVSQLSRMHTNSLQAYVHNTLFIAVLFSSSWSLLLLACLVLVSPIRHALLLHFGKGRCIYTIGLTDFFVCGRRLMELSLSILSLSLLPRPSFSRACLLRQPLSAPALRRGEHMPCGVFFFVAALTREVFFLGGRKAFFELEDFPASSIIILCMLSYVEVDRKWSVQ